MFDIGSVVNVKVRNTHIISPMYSNEPDVYVSTVLKSEKYDDANTIRLASTNVNAKAHVIPLRKVIEVNGQPFAYKSQPAPKVHSISGSKGAVYQVTINPTGNNHCTCSAFQFRGGNCKHIQSLLT